MAKPFHMNYKQYEGKPSGNPDEWKKSFHSRIFTSEEVKEIRGSFRQGETPYTILDITTSATQDEIKKAYRKKVMQWHPDRNPDNVEEATVMFRKIQFAYESLTQ